MLYQGNTSNGPASWPTKRSSVPLARKDECEMSRSDPERSRLTSRFRDTHSAESCRGLDGRYHAPQTSCACPQTTKFREPRRRRRQRALRQRAWASQSRGTRQGQPQLQTKSKAPIAPLLEKPQLLAEPRRRRSRLLRSPRLILMLDATTGEVRPISRTMHPTRAPPSHPLIMATSMDATMHIVDLIWDALVLIVDTIF